MKRMLLAAAASVLAVLSLAGAVVAEGLQDELVAREKALWTAWGNGDGDAFRAHLTEDFVQIVAGMGMVQGRDAVASEVDKDSCDLKSVDFADETLHQPAEGVAILSYVATQDATCEGEVLPAKVAVTTIFVRQGEEWKEYWYQETPIE